MKNYMYVWTGEKAALSEIKAKEILEGATFAGGVPNSMHPYDLDLNGQKVEVKMSTTYPIWSWVVSHKQAKIIDYVLLMGYDAEMNLKKAFLVPMEVVKHRDSYRGLGFRINDKSRKSNIYSKFEVTLKAQSSILNA